MNAEKSNLDSTVGSDPRYCRARTIPGYFHRAVLDGQAVQYEEDMGKWAAYMRTENRFIERTVVGEGVDVSTVFLGLDCGIGDQPQWFETLVIGGEHDGEMRRAETYADALRNHAVLVAKCTEL